MKLTEITNDIAGNTRLERDTAAGDGRARPGLEQRYH